MAEPSSSPTLTPQFCFSTVLLRDFLRVSRGAIDDSITQNLNALYTPAKSGFNPAAIAQRPSQPRSRQLSPESCRTFRDQVLLPSWKTRTDVLNYCASVATSPDPNDPEAALRELEQAKNKERVIDERLDPYSARVFPREPRTEQLAALIRQERSVEHIVRARSWGLYKERCEDPSEEWEDAMKKWIEKQA